MRYIANRASLKPGDAETTLRCLEEAGQTLADCRPKSTADKSRDCRTSSKRRRN